MLTEKAPAEKLDDNNQKIIQKCFGRYLYYDRAVDPAMLMELKSLAEVHTKAKIKTAKQLTQFLNYSEDSPYPCKQPIYGKRIRC